MTRWLPGLVLGLLCASAGAAAQDYPLQTVTIVVPDAPGVAIDIMARLIAPDMARQLGQPVIVENKPGAENVLGFDFVAKHKPDGYALMVASLAVQALMPHTVKALPFDPTKDFQPIIGIARQRMFFVSASTQPWTNFTEMVAYAKQNPGQLNFGTSSFLSNLILRGLARQLGIEATAVPYSSSARLYQALLSGEIQLGWISAAQVISFGKQMRLLALSGTAREPAYPEVPSLAELGLSSLITSSIFALEAPAGTPKPVIDKLYAAASEALRQPQVEAQFARAGMVTTSDPPDIVTRDLADQVTVLDKLMITAGPTN